MAPAVRFSGYSDTASHSPLYTIASHKASFLGTLDAFPGFCVFLSKFRRFSAVMPITDGESLPLCWTATGV